MMKWPAHCLALLGLLGLAASAQAFPLRSPQVPFVSGPLQAYLNTVDPGINVLADQLNAPVWTASVTGNVNITLTRLGPASNASGVYNANDAIPALRAIFAAGTVPGWYASLHFAGGNLSVNLFDQNSLFVGTVVYPGVDPNAFGFYTQGPCGTWYSQDARNPGPQMLAYASPAIVGDYWLCWSACKSDPAVSTFDDVVLSVQSVHPTGATRSTWGTLKGLYR